MQTSPAAASRAQMRHARTYTHRMTALQVPMQLKQHAHRLQIKPMAMSDRNPFTEMDAFDAMMARQSAIMDRQFAAMTRQIEEDVNQSLRMARQMEIDAARQMDEALSKAEQSSATIIQQPNVQIKRSEERGANSYRYYESISITTGPRYGTVITSAPPQFGPSPLLLLVAICVGMYAAAAAAFARNFDLTTYKGEFKWKLALMWPVLMLTSPSYRAQFLAAIRGIKPAPKEGSQQDS